MIIGEHQRDGDLMVNPVKQKHLTNFRAAGKEESIRLIGATEFNLEKMIAYIQGFSLFDSDDEVIEITPKILRSRKLELDERKRRKL
jgi:GTP-binding protein